jgi:predicted LPLAT superfamily acyltransferase
VAEDAAQGRSILFEVADFALCLQLFKRLETDWPARLVGRSAARFVSVAIDPEATGMKALLDTVAAWAGEVGLGSVNFHVGDQMSVVFATPPSSGV